MTTPQYFVFRKNSDSWISGQSLWETRYLHSFKISLAQYLEMTKGKVVMFGESGRQHLTKVSMSANTFQHCERPAMMHWEGCIPSLVSPSIMLNPNLFIRKHHTNPNREKFCNITGQYSSKVPRSWETKMEELAVLKE